MDTKGRGDKPVSPIHLASEGNNGHVPNHNSHDQLVDDFATL